MASNLWSMAKSSEGQRPLLILTLAAMPDPEFTAPDLLVEEAIHIIEEATQHTDDRRYDLIVFCAGVSRESRPSLAWIVRAFKHIPRRYKKSIARLYLVHQRTWIRVATQVLEHLVSAKFHRKIHHVETLAQLRSDYQHVHQRVIGTLGLTVAQAEGSDEVSTAALVVIPPICRRPRATFGTETGERPPLPPRRDKRPESAPLVLADESDEVSAPRHSPARACSAPQSSHKILLSVRSTSATLLKATSGPLTPKAGSKLNQYVPQAVPAMKKPSRLKAPGKVNDLCRLFETRAQINMALTE
ncbi:hypothetical protein PYCC9005_001397 [Savitreella phatthalungensis]